MSADTPTPAPFDEAEAASRLDAGGIHIELDMIFNEMRDRLRVVDVVLDLLHADELIDAARPAALILKDAATDLAWQLDRAELFADLDLKRNHGKVDAADREAV